MQLYVVECILWLGPSGKALGWSSTEKNLDSVQLSSDLISLQKLWFTDTVFVTFAPHNKSRFTRHGVVVTVHAGYSFVQSVMTRSWLVGLTVLTPSSLRRNTGGGRDPRWWEMKRQSTSNATLSPTQWFCIKIGSGHKTLTFGKRAHA